MDHAEILGKFEIGDRTNKKPLLKDWVLMTEEFTEQAKDIIRDAMLDHDKHFKNRSYRDREEYTQDQQTRQYEGNLDITDQEEGICHAHVLMIIINRLTTLHRRVQAELTKKSREKLSTLHQEIGEVYKQVDSATVGEQQEAEQTERLVQSPPGY